MSQNRSETYVLEDGSLSVVSLLTKRRVADIGTTPGPFPVDQTAIGLVRNNTRAYIGLFPREKMKVFDTETRKVTRVVNIGLGATAVTAAVADGVQYAFISLLTDQSLAVVRTSDNVVVKHVPLPRGPMTVQKTPSGRSVWAGSSFSGMIWVVNTSTMQMTRKFAVKDAGPVQSIAFSNNGKRAFVMGLGGLQIVEVSTGKELAFVPMPRLFPGVADLNAGPDRAELDRHDTARRQLDVPRLAGHRQRRLSEPRDAEGDHLGDRRHGAARDRDRQGAGHGVRAELPRRHAVLLPLGKLTH